MNGILWLEVPCTPGGFFLIVLLCHLVYIFLVFLVGEQF